MIIDMILDRKNGCAYTAEDCHYILEQAHLWEFNDIAKAIDNENNEALQKALCEYCREYYQTPKEYAEICNYINALDWLGQSKPPKLPKLPKQAKAGKASKSGQSKQKRGL